ncbi:hypothetical protein EIQ00_05445 [Xanthomonas campestris pv. raphani]
MPAQADQELRIHGHGVADAAGVEPQEMPGCGGPVVKQVLPVPMRCQRIAPAGTWRQELRSSAMKKTALTAR